MRLKKYSTLILRIGLSAVLYWFSINQFINPEGWTRLVPAYLNFITPLSFIYINATFEIILATLLLIGLFTRIVALLFTIHLIPIIVALGYGPSAVRDLGLLFASLSLAISGSDCLSLDLLIKEKFMKKQDK